ncbi:hemicentin-2-like isoform X4 [Toxorhynchites rutilus septentrionalis]|uniref:hemicentin-2-like isoform X4 n=1 Tax=Toxorhynchites rutilus septentrionalis TaxID=329112 RepID=UPI00247A72C1|nr:hemicentin-2-like isoform X4 [Toxorhynchites rutilus septentrionalis]
MSSRKTFRNRTLSSRRVATLTRATLIALSLMYTVADSSAALNGIQQSSGSSGGGARDKPERVHHYGGLTSSSGLSPSSSSSSSSSLVAGNGSAEKPYFEDINSRNVTTVVDDTAVLKCRVKYKGDRTVSWMRKRDLHILTSNIYTYTGDQRFSVIHPPDSDDWDLKISYAQQKDSGIYECQVNTEPKINLAVYLTVSAVRAKITGSQEVYVKKGSTISLSCVVNVHASSISWYHGSAVVDFDSARGGISLETEKTEGGTSSRLMLTRATLKDSGNYTCVPTGAIAASVQVHVLNGEHPAAMQTSAGAVVVLFCPTRYMLVFILVSLNSCNLSKLIHFISSLFEAARFALASAVVSLLTRIRRPVISSIDSSSSSSKSCCCSESCNHQSVSSLYHPNISIQSLNSPPTLSQRR